MNILWVTILAKSLNAALSSLCYAKPPFKLCDKFKIEQHNDYVVIIGSRAVGIATKHGDGYKAMLMDGKSLYVVIYAPNEELVVSGEACTLVSKVAEGECPRLKYEVWCRWCTSPNGKRYKRCWADVATKSDEVRRVLTQLGLSDIEEKRLEEVLKTLSSICS